jgi:hypothetical protein
LGGAQKSAQLNRTEYMSLRKNERCPIHHSLFCCGGKTLGYRCRPTSLTLTQFSKQLAAEWQDASCGGGQMLLTKAK